MLYTQGDIKHQNIMIQKT